MDSLMQDLRFAVRTLRRNASLSAVIVLTLTLGIGANAAIFSVVNAYLLRALPFEKPEELVHVWQTKAGVDYGDSLRVSEANFLDWKTSANVFSDLAAYYYSTRTVTDADEPFRVMVGSVTWNLPGLLGVRPVIGRSFREEDGEAGSARVVLLSHPYWQRQLAGEPHVLGRNLELDGVSYTVIGVMPPSFVFPLSSTRMWVPLALTGDESKRGSGALLVVGRLAPGTRLPQAQAAMQVAAHRLAEQHPGTNAGFGARVVPLREALVFFLDQLRAATLALLVAVGLVLLIVCSNVGNLLLARAASRAREMAVRTAVGASRLRLVRQLLVEGGVLAALGGTLGALVAVAAGGSLGAALPADIYRVGELSVDGRVLAFTAGLSVFSVFLFALAPALQASRVNLVDSLKEGDRGPGMRGSRLRSLLTVSQVGLATALLFGALFSITVFDVLRRTDPGFAVDDVLTLEAALPSERYPSGERQNAFYEDLAERVRTLPGVAAAASVYPLPMNFELDQQEFTIEGRTPVEADRRPIASQFLVAPGYFETMQIPVLAGRGFTSRDTGGRPLVAVVNRRLARQHWPDQDPVGQRLRLHERGGPDEIAEVVGVVADSKDFLMHEEFRPQIFLSQLQRSTSRRFLTVRATSDPMALIPAVKGQVRELDRTLAVTEVRRMTQVVFGSVAPVAGVAAVLGALGFGALLLAALGIYGVVSFSVRQRTHEIGVRMALGASVGQVVRLVLKQGFVLVAIGLAMGVVLVAGPTLVAERLGAKGLLQPWALLASTLILSAAGLGAAYLPARRAARVEPSVALRHE